MILNNAESVSSTYCQFFKWYFSYSCSLWQDLNWHSMNTLSHSISWACLKILQWQRHQLKRQSTLGLYDVVDGDKWSTSWTSKSLSSLVLTRFLAWMTLCHTNLQFSSSFATFSLYASYTTTWWHHSHSRSWTALQSHHEYRHFNAPTTKPRKIKKWNDVIRLTSANKAFGIFPASQYIFPPPIHSTESRLWQTCRCSDSFSLHASSQMLLLPRVHSVQDFATFELGNGISCGLSCGMQRKLKFNFLDFVDFDF